MCTVIDYDTVYECRKRPVLKKKTEESILEAVGDSKPPARQLITPKTL